MTATRRNPSPATSRSAHSSRAEATVSDETTGRSFYARVPPGERGPLPLPRIRDLPRDPRRHRCRNVISRQGIPSGVRPTPQFTHARIPCPPVVSPYRRQESPSSPSGVAVKSGGGAAPQRHPSTPLASRGSPPLPVLSRSVIRILKGLRSSSVPRRGSWSAPHPPTGIRSCQRCHSGTHPSARRTGVVPSLVRRSSSTRRGHRVEAPSSSCPRAVTRADPSIGNARCDAYHRT